MNPGGLQQYQQKGAQQQQQRREKWQPSVGYGEKPAPVDWDEVKSQFMENMISNAGFTPQHMDKWDEDNPGALPQATVHARTKSKWTKAPQVVGGMQSKGDIMNPGSQYYEEAGVGANINGETVLSNGTMKWIYPYPKAQEKESCTWKWVEDKAGGK